MMKTKYETPSAEMLEFNYTDVVAASRPAGVTLIGNAGCADSIIFNESGKTDKKNKNDQCVWIKPTTNETWDVCLE